MFELYKRRVYIRWWLSVGSLLSFCSIVYVVLPSPLTVVALFMILTATLCAFYRPGWTLILLATCTSMPSVVFPLPGHNMHLAEPAILLVVLTALFHHQRLSISRAHLFALLFLAVAILSFLHVPELASSDSPYAAEKRLVICLLTFFIFFAATSLASRMNAALFSINLVWACLPASLIGLAQMAGLQLPIGLEDAGRGQKQLLQVTQGRLWGPFAWPVNFGMYLGIIFALAFSNWLLGARRSIRWMGAFFTCLTAFEIIETGTRSALLAIIVIVVVGCLVTRHYKTLGLCLLVTGWFSLSWWPTLSHLFEHDINSTDNRLMLWQETLKLIMAHPFLGIGLEQFPHYYKLLIIGRAAQLGTEGIHPHQQYLEWALESGLLWLLIGIALLISLLSLCWKAYRQAEEGQQNLPLAAFLALLATCIISFFDTPLDQLEATTLLFLLLGVTLGRTLPALEQQRSSIVPRVYNGNSYSQKTDKQDVSRIFFRSLAVQIKKIAVGGVSPKRLVQGNIRAYQQEDGQEKFLVKRIGWTIIIQLLSWGIALPLVFPVTALLTRYLGPEQYGQYSLTVPFLSIFAFLSGTGMDPLIVRQLSSTSQREWGTILGEAVGTRLVSTLLSSGLAAIVVLLLPVSWEERSLLWLGSSSLLFSFSFNGLRIIYTHGFRAEQRITFLAGLEACNRIVTALLIVIAIYLHYPLFWLYAIIIYSDIPFFLLLIMIAHRRYRIRPHFRVPHFCHFLLIGLPLSGHDALTLLVGQLDLWLLSFLAGPLQTGLYALATRIIDPLVSIVIAYTNGIYPYLCQKYYASRQQFAQAYYQVFRVLILCTFPLMIYISSSTNLLINWLGGKRFQGAEPVMQMLIATMFFTFCNQLAYRGSTAAHRQ